MTLKTWIAEFYPVPAENLKEAFDSTCIKHSIKKWEGLRPDALKRHDVTFDRGTLEGEGGLLEINDLSCALCVKHLNPKDEVECYFCPLERVRGNVPCDCETFEEERSPFAVACREGAMDEPDVEPMIYWLKECEN